VNGSSTGRRRLVAAAVAAAIVLALAPARSGPLSDEESRALLAALEGPSGSAAREAIDRILEAGDRRFVSVFVELLRASESGVAAPGVRDQSARALERLTREPSGRDWSAWVRWYSESELEPPPGFLGFKGRLLSRIDLRFGDLLQDDLPRRIRVEEIVWGGVAYEGIPALDRVAAVPAREASYLGPDEPVFGVQIGAASRAYPLRILDWHELANDELGGVPIALAYCTLCGSGIVYEARAPGHDRLDFGSSGLLMRSNKLMVDRQTRTLWNQLTGEPVFGALAGPKLRLRPLASVVTRWRDWLVRHPDTTVLSLETGHDRPYLPGEPYADYFASPATMFPVARRRSELPEKERIFGVERDGRARAWPLATLLERRVVNDAVGDLALVLVAHGEGIWVEGSSRRSGPFRYESGGEVRAYRRGARAFRTGEGRDDLVDDNGQRWSIEEDALRSGAGARFERVPGVLSYWFAWQAFHPQTDLYQPPGSQ
jgi:hypothetical protein